MLDWHTASHTQVLEELKSTPQGLDEREAKSRLQTYGQNEIKIASTESIPKIILRQINNPLIYVLILSTLLAILIGKMSDAAVVFIVILLNSFIGFIQEYKSSRTIQALLEMMPNKSTVIRNGATLSIPSHLIVPGDVVVLEAGDRVCADIRLFSVKNLGCDESALTGESLPVFKRIEPVGAGASLVDRKCMAYNGTLVTSGMGTGVVVATGLKTEFGKISELLEQTPNLETPLMRSLRGLASYITIGIILASIGLFIVGYFRGFPLFDAAISSIALAVAAIPEGLPATVTIAAAIGVQRMAKRNAIIRHLLAVETLGSTTVICTDKTGTLTENQMTVQSIWTPLKSYFATGVGYSLEGEILESEGSDIKEKSSCEAQLNELLTAAMLCNEAYFKEEGKKWIPHGEPTELALLVAGRKMALDEKKLRQDWPKIDFIPFDSEKRLMGTLHASPAGEKVLFTKGAPEVIIQLCETERDYSPVILKMARQGMRVIAIARKKMPSDQKSIDEENMEQGFELLGFLGMIDPPREGVLDAIKSCREAGITVKMITGDHPLTAHVIGKELGLQEGDAIVAGEIEQLPREQFHESISKNHIFARALPKHKLQIIEALQNNGEIVAMTGDGVNDAPALKKANIGVAMGISGTAVAKEASDMVLADDNFTSIQAAVEEGRRVYDNLVKSIAFIFPTSLAQSLMIFFAVLFFPMKEPNLMLPILPIQVLWINLIVAVALALPLAFETMEPDIMQRPPRHPKAPIFNRFLLIRTLIIGGIMAGGTIGLFLWEYTVELARGIEQKRVLSEAQTMSVTSLVFFQVFYLLNCRSFRLSILRMNLFSNPYILLGIGFVAFAQIAFVYVPAMNTLFKSSPLNLEAWCVSIAVGAAILPLLAIEKWIYRILAKKKEPH